MSCAMMLSAPLEPDRNLLAVFRRQPVMTSHTPVRRPKHRPRRHLVSLRILSLRLAPHTAGATISPSKTVPIALVALPEEILIANRSIASHPPGPTANKTTPAESARSCS